MPDLGSQAVSAAPAGWSDTQVGQDRSPENSSPDAARFENDKLASVGRLAAGIAHEINTPIQYVGDNIQALSEFLQDLTALIEKYRVLVALGRDGTLTKEAVAAVETAEAELDLTYMLQEAPNAIQEACEGVGRVTEIVRAMKDFSHVNRGEATEADIVRILRNTLTVARNEYKYVADVETQFEDLPDVECYASEISQVILNILINAAHAIGDTGQRGTITIRAYPEDDEVVISIADTGTGIPDHVRDKIFGPFFTTKEVGKGTGQGLNIAYHIVTQRHNGSLTFDTQPGQGTTFFIRLPVRLSDAGDVPADDEAPA